MQLTNTPGKLVLPFANAGAKNIIPTASQIGITAGAASLTDGFPPLTRTPIAAGGVPPSGLDMNGILFQLSAILRWANAGGGYAYDAAFATDSNVGGYPKGARIMRSDGLGYWFNTVENNTTDPEAAGAAAAGWVPDFTNGAAAVTMTNANVTLTPVQYGKPVIVISGALTANLNLIFPSIVAEWVIINNTTGNFSITAKTSGGTGTVVTGVQCVIGDGTNIYTVGPNNNPVISLKNKLINGNFNVNQRAYVSGTATGSANQYTLDRWRVVTSGQNVSWALSGAGQRITAPAGGIEQVIESINIEGGIYCLSWTGTATATVNGDAVANGGTVSLPANANVTVRFIGGTVENAQFELGTNPTKFDQRFFGFELALCQRYYESGATNWAVGLGSSTTDGNTYLYYSLDIPFKVQKRVNPTLTTTAPPSNPYAIALFKSADVNKININNSGAYLSQTSVGSNAFNTSWTADAEL